MVPNELSRAFGAGLKRKRIERAITQAELARRADMTRTSITNIEMGNQGVPLSAVYRLADALSITPQELLPEVRPIVGQARLPERVLREVSQQYLDDVAQVWGRGARQETEEGP